MLNDIRVLLGGTTGGQLIHDHDGLVQGNWAAIVVNYDAEFEELDVDGTSVVVQRGLKDNMLASGMYLGAGFNYTDGRRAAFTAIKVASGSVIAY